MTYQDLFFLQTKYLVESACKSDFLVCVSLQSFRFCFASLLSINPIQYSDSKKASYQGAMIIEMTFVLICVSVALLYQSIVIREGMQDI